MHIFATRNGTFIKKILLANRIETEKGMKFGGIYDLEDPGKTIWKSPDNGRTIVMHSDYKGKSVQEWSREGYNVFEVSEGYTVPYGFDE